MRILVICETIDFQNFTSRYTTEALGRANAQTVALCHTHVRNLFKTNLFSKFLNVTCYYGLIPFGRKRGILRKLEYLMKVRWQRFFRKFDVVVISCPNQNYFLDFITPDQKVVYLICDPYCLMDYSREKELEVLHRADLIMATAKNLADIYVKKYYNLDKSERTHFWPNCVEVSVWKADDQYHKTSNAKPVIGFAGNFMKLVDLQLLEKVVKKFNDCQIIICGKISYNNPEYRAFLDKIFQYPNVLFKGFIPYAELPAEVQKWDICIMVDDVSELSSYHHHNKLYQYLALGKPVVAQRNQRDHDLLADIIYLADTHEEYLVQLEKALNENDNGTLYQKRIKAAHANSADARAQQLKTEILKLCGSR